MTTSNFEEEKIKYLRECSEYFSVMPIRPKSKWPVEKWKVWQEKKRMFNPQDFKHRNAGFICGAISNLVVLDVDHVELFDSVMKRYGFEIPDTYTVKTGKGFHYYFDISEESVAYKTKALKTLGIDIQGEGSYVLTPYSIHPDTNQPYVVINQAGMVAPPGWLKDMILKPTPDKWRTLKV
jgi:hypothetical protein